MEVEMMEEATENIQYASFGRFEEFMKLEDAFLAIDFHAEPSEQEKATEKHLSYMLMAILVGYTEQPYLLDPFLERMVTPVVNRCKTYAAEFVNDKRRSRSYWRPANLFILLHHFITTRGAKTIVHFFPHQIEDLSVALSFLNITESPAQDPLNWQIRYIVLLWLSLICRIPFDLSRFDSDGMNTFNALESAAHANLAKAGLEKEGAGLLLAHLYARKDAGDRLDRFIELKIDEIKRTSDVFLTIGTLQVLCELTKDGSTSGVKLDLPSIGRVLEDMKQEQKLNTNTLVKKWQVKLTARVALCFLPSRAMIATRKKQLMSGVQPVDLPEVDDFEIPEEVESAIEDLLSRLQDRDTTVRWSAAKGIARIAERLPKDLSDQILESVMALYSIHAAAMEDGTMDLPAAAEGTWHGATLACAELARRGIVSSTSLPTLVNWVKQALYFDIRKGAHSIGSNVRDAAAYVMWSMARALNADAMRPFAVEVAQRLVTVACFDREIHIRRAASAAFQENVGRMSLFPHGIDTIRKTDFYSVSIRKNAFFHAAPQVAEHEVYRSFLVDHLHSVTLTHWDPTMRQSGALALREICKLDLKALGPKCAFRASTHLTSVDSGEVDGGLRALAEIACAYKEAGGCEDQRLEVFEYLIALSPSTFTRYRNELIVEAACLLISNTISERALSLHPVDSWMDIVNIGLRHREAAPQEAAAKAMRSISMVRNCSAEVNRFISEFAKGSPIITQSIPLALSALAYKIHPHGASEAIQCLLNGITEDSPTYTSNVEARRNCTRAIASILQELGTDISNSINPSISQRIIQSMLKGLEDYTTDERGDVGSWIRMSSIAGLISTFTLYFTISESLPAFEQWLPSQLYHKAVSGILKQGADRLDNVRHEAGEHLLRLVAQPLPLVPNQGPWIMAGRDLFSRLFPEHEEAHSWGDGAWLFPKIVKLIEVPDYRQDILTGLSFSIGSRNESTTRPASTSIVGYSKTIPVDSAGEAFDRKRLLADLMQLGQKHSTNNNMFIPFLQTLDVLLEGGALTELGNTQSTMETLRGVLNFAVKGADRIKNVQRIMVSMKILIGLIGCPNVSREAVGHLPSLLCHRFPKVRAATAEALYLALQGLDLELDDVVEESLLGTSWLQPETELQEIVTTVVDSLQVAAGGNDA